jgi:hypothetical protein
VVLVRARHWLAGLAGVLAFWPALPAWSVPVFARETGLPCAVCHTLAFGPALTAYGRNFKLHAYALGTQKTIPLSADLIASFTHTAQSEPAVPHYSDNNNLALDSIDAYLGGRIANHFGAFAQVSYDGIARHTSWGVFDARYAQDFTFGGRNALLGQTGKRTRRGTAALRLLRVAGSRGDLLYHGRQHGVSGSGRVPQVLRPAAGGFWCP